LTGESSSRECAANASFKALKTVFCKTNANTGDGMRFGLARLFHLLDAARLRRNQSNAGTISGAGLSALEDCDRRTGFKFWSIDDPSIQIAEFVHCLAIMGRPDKPSESILETVCINYENGFAEIICEIKIELKENMGGSEKRRLDLFAREISGLCDLSDIHNTNKITILFSVSPDGTFTPTFQT
jgi:hypothetical protein